MWHCVISWGVIACKLASNCFKYYHLWYTVRFACCYWDKMSKFNVFPLLPVSTVSVSDNCSSPNGDSRWGRGKWLEVTVVRSLAHFSVCIEWQLAHRPVDGNVYLVCVWAISIHYNMLIILRPRQNGHHLAYLINNIMQKRILFIT